MSKQELQQYPNTKGEFGNTKSPWIPDKSHSTRSRLLKLSPVWIIALAAACSPPMPDVTPLAASTASTPTFKITVFKTGNPDLEGKVSVDLCTEGRPNGTTIRMKLLDSLVGETVTVDGLTKRIARYDWELGVDCTGRNPANPDNPILHTRNLPLGDYHLLGQGRPTEAGGDWNHPSVKSEIIPFKVP